tara:strand:- start:1482 stop:1709 length:228 start_codon:yes stop_codon:yes gene_type:complete
MHFLGFLCAFLLYLLYVEQKESKNLEDTIYKQGEAIKAQSLYIRFLEYRGSADHPSFILPPNTPLEKSPIYKFPI